MVETAKCEFGFNLCLDVLDFEKGNWDYHNNKSVIKEEKYEHLEEPLDQIVEEHPEYGGRKIKAELEEEYGHKHGRELIYELLRMFGLKREQNARKTAKSGYRKAIEEAGDQANLVDQLEEITLFDVVYTDFTNLPYAGGSRKGTFMAIIGHTSKLIFGWSLGRTRSTDLAVEAFDGALETFDRLGIDPEEVILHQDRDSVYTGEEWVNRTFGKEGISLSYSMNGAKGNTYMESFNGHFKNPVESIFVTSETLEKLKEAAAERVEYWNQERRHGVLGNQTPMEFIQEKI